jgi:4-amino-4-deoxy-L-arabinose transferase-like glycosyltransferase
MKEKTWQLTTLLILLIILITSFFLQLTSFPIRIWDESRLANNAQHMYLHGNWLITFYKGQPDMLNTKPPLMIWLQVAGMYIFGMNELAVRLPSAVAATCTGLLLWFFSKKYFNNSWIGFLAGCVFASTYAFIYIHAGRTGDYDALLILFMTAYCFSFFRYLNSTDKKYAWWFWICVTLAVMTKGVAGLLLLPALFFYSIFEKKAIRIFKKGSFYIGLIFFLIIIGGYYFLRERYDPGYLKAVYDGELTGRYFSTIDAHSHPFGYYFNNMRTWRDGYWFYFILPAFVAGLLSRDKRIKQISLFNLVIVLSYWLIISFANTKLEWYDLPLYPFLSLQTGLLIYLAWHRLNKYLSLKIWKPVIAVLLFSLIFFIPARQAENYIHHFKEQPWDIEPHKQGWLLHEYIKKKKNLDNYVFCYDGYDGQIDFYIKKLQAEGMLVQLQNTVENITGGKIVVVSQEKLNNDLLTKYLVKKIDGRFGCTIYQLPGNK